LGDRRASFARAWLDVAWGRKFVQIDRRFIRREVWQATPVGGPRSRHISSQDFRFLENSAEKSRSAPFPPVSRFIKYGPEMPSKKENANDYPFAASSE
jgi:hypothetical protein